MLLFRKLYFKLIDLSWQLLTISMVALISLSTIALPLIEPETFKTHIDSLYFTMTTVPTIGYGDLSPHTTEGRIFTMIFLQVIGVGLFTTVIAKAIDGFLAYKRKKESGEIMYEGKNHFVIIDWSHKSENAIKNLLEKDAKSEIVVIDTIEKLPLTDARVHYVKGSASSTEILNKANVKEARSVVIFSDDRIGNQMLTDAKSLMIATAVERIAPNVHTTVEIEREEHIDNFRHINIDEFIVSNDTIAKKVLKSIL